MIKAGSLFYAVVISLIIAIVSSSLILFAYLSHIQFETFEIDQRLQLNADSGLNLLLSKQSLIQINEKKTIDLHGQAIDSVEIYRKPWGAYEIAISKAKFRTISVLRVAQIGFCQDTSNIYSVYLSDEGLPLTLSGKTIIKGTAFLPKAGVKSGYVEGQNYIGTELIYGHIKNSDKILPDFNSALIDNIQSVFKAKQLSNADSLVYIENDLLGDSIKNSFTNNSVVFYSENSFKISGGTFSGNIAFISDKQITIMSNSILHDVMIFAPKIIIEKGFKGNLQLFATDSVIVEKNVALLYPSVIGVISDKSSLKQAAIIIGENDTISGNVFSYRKKIETTNKAGLIIEKSSLIYGQVYSNGSVALNGTIYGSLMCNKVVFQSPSTTLDNYLLNVVIDRSKLSRYYVGINLVEEAASKNIVKWGN